MEKQIFKRKIYGRMLDWKLRKRGSTALLIKGARRVGKSTLVENFARNEYKSYVRIDFSNVAKEMNALFDDMSNLDLFFMKLYAFTGVRLYERESVVIFDEVQLQPRARQAIKHLVADGRYDYIETGSLLSLKRNVKDIVIPSEETRMALYPLDYEEFLWTMGDQATMEMLRMSWKQRMPLGDAVNRKLMRDFRLYMVVGGMPQAVCAYLETHDLAEVDEVKRAILDLYDDDFHKIDSSGSTSLLFRDIPGQLSRNTSRYCVGSVIEGARNSRLYSTIGDMADSMTVNVAYHASDPSVGMALHKDISRFKMYLCDTGLFVTLAFKDKDTANNVLYQKLLSDKLSADLGYVYENVVAQMLCAAGHELFYYTFPKEGLKHNYEVDFLLSRGEKVCPIEVKSSGYKTHASIDAFCEKFSNRVLNPTLLFTKDYRKDGAIQCMPVYMAGLL